MTRRVTRRWRFAWSAGRGLGGPEADRRNPRLSDRRREARQRGTAAADVPRCHAQSPGPASRRQRAMSPGSTPTRAGQSKHARTVVLLGLFARWTIRQAADQHRRVRMWTRSRVSCGTPVRLLGVILASRPALGGTGWCQPGTPDPATGLRILMAAEVLTE